MILTQPEIRKFIKTVNLAKGKHSPDHTFCVMEAVAYVAGEKWTDRPQCASPLLTDFCICWNDAMNDEDRQTLRPFIPRLVNTKASPAVERERSYLALNWYCRVSAPAWLRAAGLIAEAKAIERTAPIVDVATARAATAALRLCAASHPASHAGSCAASPAATRAAARKSALGLLDRMIRAAAVPA